MTDHNDHHHHHHHIHSVADSHREHGHSDSGKPKATDYAAANKEYFTGATAMFEQPEWTQLAKKSVLFF